MNLKFHRIPRILWPLNELTSVVVFMRHEKKHDVSGECNLMIASNFI